MLESEPEMRLGTSLVFAICGLLVIVALVVAPRLPKETSDAVQQSPAPSQSESVPAAPVIPPAPKCPETSLSKSRQRLAETLQAIYKTEGRMLTVTVQGDNCDILQLAGMLARGNYTMEAAQRETINCSHCMLAYRKTKFKAIRFLGPDLNWQYDLK